MIKKSAPKNRQNHISPGIGLLFLALLVAGIGFHLVAYIRESAAYETVMTLNPPVTPGESVQDIHLTQGSELIERFTSENDFKKYLTDSGSLAQSFEDSFLDALSPKSQNPPAVIGQSDASKKTPSVAVPSNSPDDNQDLAYSTQARDDWFSDSQTNNIDRTDIAKSDTNSLFFSPDDQYFLQSKSKTPDLSTFSARQKTVGKTDIISMTALDSLKNLASVDGKGEIMLSQNILAVFSANQILGYDISDPAKPQPKWKIRLDDKSQVVDSLVREGVLYLVIRSDIDFANPCPIRPILDGDNPLLIKCEDIYRPVENSSVDTTFTVLTLDALSGAAQRTISFVGSSASEIYISGNYLYATWGFEGDPARFFSDFISDRGQNLFPDYVGQKISKLVGYDIANQTKMRQIDLILAGWAQSLPATELTSFKNDLSSRLAEYSSAHSRDLDRTAIAKIDLDDFKVLGSGEVGGHPLDRLSLNENNGALRVGVAVGSVQELGFMPSAVTNDVYVLDNDLQVVGSALDLGFGQQISSARFAGDTGYLVTAREMDPIYVLDMSSPLSPKLAGKIDLPGSASFVHKISDTKIIAVSKDNLKTRISLYDVSLPSDPKLLDKYQLDEYWTDIDDNHEAYYQDGANKLFYVPGAKSGYIFGYTDDKISLQKNITGVSAVRVLGSQNYLYLIGDERIWVVDESTLEKVSHLDVK